MFRLSRLLSVMTMRFSVRRKRREGAGFSLIELMVAIVLLMLIVLVGLPAFTGIMASMRVRAVSESLLSGVQMARTEAVRRNQPVSFHLDAEDGGGWSVLLVEDASVLQAKPASEGGTVNVQSDLGTTVTFNNLGQRLIPAGGVLTFSFTNPDVGECQPAGNIRCLSVTIEPGGQARLCDPQRSDPDPQAC
jgi:type IV fimbrial biogenesis protein FimT